MNFEMLILSGPSQAKKCLQACSKRVSHHSSSLGICSPLRHSILSPMFADSKYPDQTARMVSNFAHARDESIHIAHARRHIFCLVRPI